jgi:hypothetical protein
MNDASSIVEFATQYRAQVIDVIGKGLRQQKVLPEGDESIEDEDLYHIPEIFRGAVAFGYTSAMTT